MIDYEQRFLADMGAKNKLSEASKGIVLICTGTAYTKAAERTAVNIREKCPDIPVALFTDYTNQGRDDLMRDGLFDYVYDIAQPHRRSKVDCLPETPFDKTLYLDTDIRLCEDVRDIFELLDRFDIALAHAHTRNRAATKTSWTMTVPESFPQFNGGVIAYRRTDSVMRFLENWRDAYASADFAKDQVTLRELLWRSDLHIATLPPEYNIRYGKYLRVWHAQEARPKILHFEKYNYSSRVRYLKKTIKDGLKAFKNKSSG